MLPLGRQLYEKWEVPIGMRGKAQPWEVLPTKMETYITSAWDLSQAKEDWAKAFLEATLLSFVLTNSLMFNHIFWWPPWIKIIISSDNNENLKLLAQET